MNSSDVSPRDSSYGVLLPCTPETFGDFVSSLLGSPQTIERRFRGAYTLTRNDVENTYHLVAQRVAQQNEATLIEFTVAIHYHDGSSVRLNGLDDFQHYTEVRPIVSVGVHITWVFLIKFQGKLAPEKQQIDLTFLAHNVEGELEVRFSPLRAYAGGDVSFRIAHTARTWGVDLESLLAGHIEGLLQKPRGLKALVSRHSGKVGLVLGALTYLMLVSGALLSTRRFAATQVKKAAAAMELNVAAKIDFITARYAEGSWTQFNVLLTVFLTAGLVGCVFMGFWVAMSADNEPRSFVLLSKRAEENRERVLRKENRRWWILAASALAALASGVASNAIFAWAVGMLQ